MSELLKINVNDHTEKKGQLTYLSWAWAWAEVLKIDPQATWVVHMYGPQGSEQPCMWIGETAMVHTSVTINGLRRECLLPVMDNRNNAVKSPDTRKVSDAIMRCMTKAISMHGLGLYIYAGEDLPQGGDEPEEPKAGPIPDTFRSSPTMGEMEALPPEQQDYIRDMAMEVVAQVKENPKTAVLYVESQELDDTQKMSLWSLLDAPTRSAFKKAQKAMREPQPA